MTRIQDKVVATGSEYVDSGRRLKAARIGVLLPDCQDRLQDVASIRTTATLRDALSQAFDATGLPVAAS